MFYFTTLKSEVSHRVQPGGIGHRKAADYLRRVPLPSAQYIFSYQQR